MPWNCFLAFMMTWGTVNPKCVLLEWNTSMDILTCPCDRVTLNSIFMHAEELHRGSKIILQGPMFPRGWGRSDTFLVWKYIVTNKLERSGPPVPSLHFPWIFYEKFASWGIVVPEYLAAKCRIYTLADCKTNTVSRYFPGRALSGVFLPWCI